MAVTHLDGLMRLSLRRHGNTKGTVDKSRDVKGRCGDGNECVEIDGPIPVASLPADDRRPRRCFGMLVGVA